MPKLYHDKKRNRYYMQVMRNGKRKNFYSSAPTEAQARRECQRAYWEWCENGDPSKKIAFEDAWEEFIEDYGARHKATTTLELARFGKCYYLPVFKRKPVANIQRSDWQQIIQDASNRGLTHTTLNLIALYIRKFCRFCASKGYIKDSDVPQNLFVPVGAPSKPRRALYPSELLELLRSEDDGWYIPHFQFLALTGLRRGELCALQRDRDYHPPYITVRESLSSNLILDTPKSGKPRDEILSSLAQEALDRHLAMREEVGWCLLFLTC